MPYGSDNALVKAAEVVRRIAAYRPAAHIDDLWTAQVEAMPLPDDLRTALKSPDTIWSTLEGLPVPVARTCHAHTHTTFSPNVVHGGQKTNTIPDTVDIDVDIRTVPGTTREDVDLHLREALGDLYDQIEFSVLQHSDPTRCDFGPGNQLWDTLTTHTQVAYPDAKLIPGLIVGGTDARFYRERGKVAYGAGLFSPEMDFASFGTRFHGNDERIDTASLGLSGNYFYGIAKELLS
jgi:acetylornithine deacetylase/succinyl-diaminopimelate desuccinylase-like protein